MASASSAPNASSARRWRLLAPLVACLLPLAIPWLAPPTPGQQAGRKERRQQKMKREDVESSDERVRTPSVTLPITRTKRHTNVAEESTPRETPILLPRADGRTTLAFLEWIPGQGDQIVLCEPKPNEGDDAPAKPEPDPTRRVVSDKPAEILRPIGLLDARGRARLFWTELVGPCAQLRTSVELDAPAEGAPRFSEPLTLTTGPLPSSNVEAVLHDGRIWLAYEAETAIASEGRPAGAPPRGSRDVYAAPLVEDGETVKLGPPIQIGAEPMSDLDPVMASAGGRVWIAWVAYTGRDYEIRLRSIDPATGTPSPTIEVTADSQSDDLHPFLLPARDGALWLAWDRIESPTRGDSTPYSMRSRAEQALEVTVRVACVRPAAEAGEAAQVLVPASKLDGVADGVVAGAPLMSAGGGLPRLALDRGGRLWIAYRHLKRIDGTRGQEGFPVLLQRLDGGGWSAPLEISASVGVAEEVSMVPASDGDAVTVAFQCDRRFELTSQTERSRVPALVGSPLRARGVRLLRWSGAVGIGIARAELPAAAGEVTLVPRVANSTPHFHPFDGRLDDPLVSGADHFVIERQRGNRHDTWRVFWGDLHRHSNVSRCSHGIEPGPGDRWEWGRDIHLCDFMALTDHSGQMVPSQWWKLDKLAWLYQSPSFCTMSGWEWSTDEFGHHNVILPGRLTPIVGDDDTIEGLYMKFKPGDCVTIPHHSSDVNFPNDFTVVEDEHTRLIEVYQSRRGSFEFDGSFKQSPAATVLGAFVHDALNAGHKFGIIASPDHGFGQAYACVLAKSLDRKSVFDALYARRTYGATSKGMLIDLRVNDAVMGEDVICREPPRIKLHAIGATDLVDVVVYKNGKVWRSLGRDDAPLASDLATARLVVRLPHAAPAPGAAWELAVRAPKVRFEMLQDRRPFAREQGSPRWSFGPDQATLTWPADFDPERDSAEFSLHVRANEDATFTFVAGGKEVVDSVSQLRAKPVTIEGPGGPCTISIDPCDAVVDLERSLGVREITQEWVDEEFRREAWYAARFIQKDGEIAWSSPIFATSPRR